MLNPQDFSDFIRAFSVLLTMMTDNREIWDQWLRWMGLESYIGCAEVTDKGAAVVRVLFDWLWWAIAGENLGLSDIYDSCSTDY